MEPRKYAPHNLEHVCHRINMDSRELDEENVPSGDGCLPSKSQQKELNPLVVRSPCDGRLARSILNHTECFSEHSINLASIRAKLRATHMKLQEKAFQQDLLERVHKCSSQFLSNKEAIGLCKQGLKDSPQTICTDVAACGESITNTWWQLMSSRMI